MNVDSPLPSCHLTIMLFGISEKSRYPSLRFQTGPSVHLCPSSNFSTFASAGTSLSKAGSWRTILTTAFDSVEAAGAGVEFAFFSIAAFFSIVAVEQDASVAMAAMAAVVKNKGSNLFIMSPVSRVGIWFVELRREFYSVFRKKVLLQASFVPERHQRVNLRRATRREIASKQRDRRQ